MVTNLGEGLRKGKGRKGGGGGRIDREGKRGKGMGGRVGGKGMWEGGWEGRKERKRGKEQSTQGTVTSLQVHTFLYEKSVCLYKLSTRDQAIDVCEIYLA